MKRAEKRACRRFAKKMPRENGASRKSSNGTADAIETAIVIMTASVIAIETIEIDAEAEVGADEGAGHVLAPTKQLYRIMSKWRKWMMILRCSYFYKRASR